MPRNDNLQDLHPAVRQKFMHLFELLEDRYASGKTPTRFGVFETYRTPEDQDREFREGNSKARAWTSAHQFGLAADFVPLKGGQIGAWDWGAEHDWATLTALARVVGLDTPINWDRPHVESPLWRDVRAAIRRK